MTLSNFNFSIDDLAAAEAETANPYLADPAKGLQLITRLIAHPPPRHSRDQQKHLARLHQLIHQSFVSLSARDDYPAEAQSFRELLALEQSLEDLALFPDLANKTVVGVGGGFSAGKSRFLNTLLGNALLPESLEPTTAIPSFLTGGKAGIVALNTFNHPVEIDAEALQAISHAFYKHYRKSLGEEVGFAHVLKLLMIHDPTFSWDNLAILDTPGYSKSDGAEAGQTDEKIALKQLTEADHVIWLLNAKNGSIRRDDLEFLRTLNHPKPIFFVVTQADLVGHNRIHPILESTAHAIESAGIPSAGMMAWAAPLGVTEGERMAGEDILYWLNSLNSAPKYTTKRRICARLLDNHILHNSNALANNRSLLSSLNELLPLLTPVPDQRNAAIVKAISEMKSLQFVLSKLTISKKSASSVLESYGLDGVTGSSPWFSLGLVDIEKNRAVGKAKIEEQVLFIINGLKDISRPEVAPVLAKQRETIAAEINRLKNDQRRLSSLVEEFSTLKDELLETITHIVGMLAQDEEVKRGHELIYTCKREWIRQPVQLDQSLAVQVTAVKSDIKKVIVAVGDDVASLGLAFGMIRGALRIDPLGLVKGSLLAAEVRGLDEHNVTFAITNPNATE